jgi:hypothetical protein
VMKSRRLIAFPDALEHARLPKRLRYCSMVLWRLE